MHVYTFKRNIYKRVSPPPHVSDVFICVINKTFFFHSPLARFFYFCFYIIFFLVAAAAVSCRVRIVRVWVYNIISNIYTRICIYIYEYTHRNLRLYTRIILYKQTRHGAKLTSSATAR